MGHIRVRVFSGKIYNNYWKQLFNKFGTNPIDWLSAFLKKLWFGKSKIFDRIAENIGQNPCH